MLRRRACVLLSLARRGTYNGDWDAAYAAWYHQHYTSPWAPYQGRPTHPWSNPPSELENTHVYFEDGTYGKIPTTHNTSTDIYALNQKSEVGEESGRIVNRLINVLILVLLCYLGVLTGALSKERYK